MLNELLNQEINMALLKELYHRQGLSTLISERNYNTLFRNMSPVPTLFWIEPGSAPQIQYRCDFDDYETNDFSRKTREIVKGRFQKGRVGYVFQEDLPLFMAAYKKDIKSFTEHEEIVLNILKNEGPMNIGLIKEISGLLSKEISKALQRLQKAFIVYEDQIELDNERAWYLLEDELSDLLLNPWNPLEAKSEVVRRFAYMNIFVDESMIKSYTGFTNKEIKLVIDHLIEQELIQGCEFDTRPGYCLSEDLGLIQSDRSYDLTDVHNVNKVYILDLNDHLVRSNETMLKDVFSKTEYKVLHYIYVSGKFIGRVLGFFRFGPNDIEAIEILEGIEVEEALKDRMIEELSHIYPHSKLTIKDIS